MSEKKIVIVGECSNGNQAVGSMWLVTKILDSDAPLSEVIEWAKKKHIIGRIILTMPEQ